jgi:hypothetical protein
MAIIEFYLQDVPDPVNRVGMNNMGDFSAP